MEVSTADALAWSTSHGGIVRRDPVVTWGAAVGHARGGVHAQADGRGGIHALIGPMRCGDSGGGDGLVFHRGADDDGRILCGLVMPVAAAFVGLRDGDEGPQRPWQGGHNAHGTGTSVLEAGQTIAPTDWQS